MAREGLRPVPQAERRRATVGQRVRQLAGPLERLLDEGADLPAGQARLGRGRVDGQDAQRAPAGAGSSTPATTSTTGFTIWRLPRYSPTLPQKMASVPSRSCLALHGWLKKTTSRGPVSSRTVTSTTVRRLRARRDAHPLHLGQHGRLGADLRVPTRRPGASGRCSGAGRS